MCLRHLGENQHSSICFLPSAFLLECLWHFRRKLVSADWFQQKSPSGKPQGPRLFYSNDYLGSVGVHLVSLEWYWIENLLRFICLVAQTLTFLNFYSSHEIGHAPHVHMTYVYSFSYVSLI